MYLFLKKSHEISLKDNYEYLANEMWTLVVLKVHKYMNNNNNTKKTMYSE